MKKQLIPYSIIFILLILSTVLSAEEVFRIAATEGPPYQGEDLKYYGFEPHIVKEAFSLEGITVKFGFFPSSRAFNNAAEGSWDAIVGWVWSAEREKLFYYSDPTRVGPLVFFHLKNFEFSWNDFGDLKNIPIGLVHKNFYGKAFETAVQSEKLNIEKVPYELLNLRKLIKGRIRLTPINQDMGYYFIRSTFDLKTAKLFTHHTKPLKTSVYHLLLSKKVKKNKRMLKLFNKGLKKLKESGRYSELLEQLQNGTYDKN